MSKKRAFDLLKYLLALGLLAGVVWSNWGTPGSNGLGDVWQRHVIEGKPIRLNFFIAAFACSGFGLLLTLIRWYFLVRAQELPFTLPAALRIGSIGFFFNICLPGSVGGDIIKAAFLAREQSRRTVAVATVIMDRVIALWALVWLVALLGCLFWLNGSLEGDAARPSRIVVYGAGAVVVGSLIVWLLLGLLPQRRATSLAAWLEEIPRVGGSAAEFWRAVWMYRCRQASVYLAMGLSWIAQVCFIVSFYCAAKVLWDSSEGHAVPGLVEHFLLVPLGLVIRAAVPLPGGIGASEFGFGKLYLYFGGMEAGGILGSLVQRVLELGLACCGLILYLRLRTPLPEMPATVVEPSDEPVPAAVGED